MVSGVLDLLVQLLDQRQRVAIVRWVRRVCDDPSLIDDGGRKRIARHLLVREHEALPATRLPPVDEDRPRIVVDTVPASDRIFDSLDL